jgi:PAS domain S-box-containing protein
MAPRDIPEHTGEPRRRISGSLRRQLLLATVSVQCVLVLGFVALTVVQDTRGARARVEQRLTYQADFLAASAANPLNRHDMATLDHLLDVQRRATSVRGAQITDLRGICIANTDSLMNGRETLREDELQAVPQIAQSPRTQVLATGEGKEGVAPVVWQGKVVGLAWVYPDDKRERALLAETVRTGLWYGLLAMAANALVSLLLAGSVLKPVQKLVGGTRKVAEGAEPSEVFPLRIASNNEIGELSDAFNDMVDSLEKQRAGLNDTLALLDSMLANAPVGFAFLDRKSRFVRVNQHLADMNHQPMSRHLGRPVGELLPPEFAEAVERMTAQVFETGMAQRDLELVTHKTDPSKMRSWIANFFPVRSSGDRVRWVGIIVSEITERKQTEEALRRTEKLAATGRLAASIAHEINNPLEGVTNLLYLLRHHDSLDEEARKYADMAQHEVSRVAEITQQTLRFYKQSTLPVTVSLTELVESVLVLYNGKIQSAQVAVEKRFRQPAQVFGLSGELRQLIANLIGNAMDAMPGGGRLILDVGPSRDAKTGENGIRLVCADTGSGMEDSVRRRIFEPFFTTKEATGTGLGLWVSAEILAKHRAHVRVRSRVRNENDGHAASGTVFMIFFPENGLDMAAVADADAKAAEASSVVSVA